MSIFRTQNPLEYAELDGIIIDERAPSPNIKGVGVGTVILVGQFQRGEHTLQRVSTTKDFFQKYGKSSYIGNIQLANKKFASLKIIRVEPTGALKATKSFTAKISFTAKFKGVYGNSIKVKIENGTTSGKKYTISDTSEGNSEYFPDEVYDNVNIAAVGNTFVNSKLIDATVLATDADPANVAATALEDGTDGAVADADYSDAIDKARVEGAGNILFLDVYTSARKTYVKSHVVETQDKIGIVAPAENDSVSTIVADVANYRDTEGRIIYANNWLQTLLDSGLTFTSPASWYASILSQTAPNIDPAYAGNTQFLYGVTAVKNAYSRDEFIQLMNAGVSTFEYDEDIGFKVKSGVTTQIVDSSKLMVFRRRMADYLTVSIAKFLKLYQNDVNSQEKRDAVKAAITSWDKGQELLKLLPSDSEVLDGKAKLIDTDSQNTNESLAEGKFIIVYKRRIYSSMRFIVLKAEIGESVVVKEQ